MTELILPETVASQLQAFPHPVNLYTASGKKLGCFVPIFDPGQYDVVGPEPNSDELDRIEQTVQWYSTDDVNHHLENLG